MTETALALDIGGGHVTAARVDLERRAVGAGLARLDLDPLAPAGVILNSWANAALEALGAGVAPSRVGVAMPSPFEYAAGISRMTHKFAALYGVNVREELRARWSGTPLDGVPLLFGNDADLFALGEWWNGVARGTSRVIGVTLGTGLGSGFVADGQVVTGGPDVPPEGELWDTAYQGGIAEDFASGRAVTRAWAARSGQTLGAAEVAARANGGDPSARAALAELGAHLGAILTPWARKFRPDCVVVGGNVARAWKHFYPSLTAALPGVPCRVTADFERSSLLGAAALGGVGHSGHSLLPGGERAT